ncbi:MAG: phosphatase PAP2 family protein [Actinomycetota bacterium]
MATARYSSIFFSAVLGFMVIYLITSKSSNSLKTTLLFILTVIIPIGISYFARPIIGRPRPFLVLDFEVLLDHYGVASFPSNHAAAALLVPAILTAFSMVYVGVHYPSDITAASMLGAVWVWAIARLCKLGRYSRRSG